jgi:hypothetical protein
MVQVERLSRLDRFPQHNLFPIAYFALIVITNAALERQFLQGELSKIIFVRFGKRDEIEACRLTEKVRQASGSPQPRGENRNWYSWCVNGNPSILAVE